MGDGWVIVGFGAVWISGGAIKPGAAFDVALVQSSAVDLEQNQTLWLPE